MPFRILAGLFCILFVVVLVIDATGLLEIFNRQPLGPVPALVIVPLFGYVALFGKIPDFLVRNLSDQTYDELARAETLFTRFDARSIAFAIVFLTMVAYMMYRHHQ